MKKLMIAVTAAVCAIGAYAEFAKYGPEDFESYEIGEWSADGWTKQEDKEYTLTITQETENGVDNKFLALETEPTGPLSKDIEATTDNVFVDTRVKFTAFEDVDPEVEEGAKIAVWLKTTEEIPAEGNAEAIPATKSLWVAAGAVDQFGQVTSKSIPVSCATEINPNEWYNLKIESVGNIRVEGTQLGFKITINGNPVTIAADALVDVWDYFTVAEADKTVVFPAITTEATIKALALAGTGAIDDITIDATAAAVPLSYPIEKDGYSITDGPELVVPGTSYEFKLTAAEGRLFADGSESMKLDGTYNSDGTVTFETEPETAEIVAENSTSGEKYISLKAAFDAVSDVEQTETEIDIKADCQYGDDGFSLYAEDVLVIAGTIAVDKDGIKLMTEDTTLTVDGTLAECDFITSGVAGFVAKFNEDDSVWYLEESGEPETYCAEIDGVKYATLAEAIAEAEPNATIKILSDHELTVRPDITKNLKLVADEYVEVWTQLRVLDAELTIGANVNILSAKNATILVCGQNAKAKLVVEQEAGVYYDTDNTEFKGFAICGNGNDAVFGADFVINGHVESCNDYAIYFPQTGTLTVGDGAGIVGAGGIYAKSGRVEITGGEVIGEAEVVEPTEYNNGTQGSGYALVLETGSAQGGYANNLSFSITGGTFLGPVYNFIRTGAEPIAPGISGGEFYTEPPATLIVKGKKAEYSEADKLYIIVDDEKPQVIPEEQGTVDIEGEGENAVAKITPNEGVTEITVNPMLGFNGKYEIPVSITKITGVEINQLIIKSAGFDIAPACKLAEGVIELDEEAKVAVGNEQIPVKPTLTAATDEVKPLVVGETTAVGVKTIPGLTYSLVRSETIGGDQKAVATVQATTARVTLTDKFEGGKPDSAFYVIQVTK